MPSRAISNQQAREFYRRAVEASLKRPVALIETGESWGRNLQIAAQWQARYTRRRDFIQGNEGWGHPLKDEIAVNALVARNLAKEAEWSLAPAWDAMTRSVVDMGLKNAFQTNRLDVSSVGEPCRFGPSLKRLWSQARSRGLSEEQAWQSVRAWATYRPPSWSTDDGRGASARPAKANAPIALWETPLIWHKTGDLEVPWAAEHGKAKLQVRLNDFPDEHMYTLVVDGNPTDDFDEWPDLWDRGDRPRSHVPKQAPWRRKVPAQSVQGRFLERYLAGEREAVWAELVSLGSAVREPQHLPEATAVARETMRRARRNVELLIQRLDKIGYRFWNAGSNNHLYNPGVFLPPSASEKAKLDKLEKQGFVLPLSLRMWMEEVGRVDFTGSHLTLSSLEHEDDFAGIYADPLMVTPNADSIEEMLGLAGDSEEDLFIAYNDWGKAAIGTNEQLDSCYSMRVPDLAADGLLMGERHKLHFVDYLRLCFRWGGFPGWESEQNLPERELAALSDRLLPI